MKIVHSSLCESVALRAQFIVHSLLALMLLAGVTFAQAADRDKLSLWLRQATAPQQQATKRAADMQDLVTVVFLRTSGTLSDETLAQYGARRYAQLGDIAIIAVPLGQLAPLAENPDVLRIEANGMAHPTLDLIPTVANILPAYEATPEHQAFTGEGVVMGIMDIGFDLTHPTFYDDAFLSRYRIQAFWDQIAPGTGDDKLPIGREWTTPAQVLAQGCATDGRTENHGTHTAGIAAGSGYDSPYRGVAFGSDLCLVANAVTSDTIYIPQENYYKYTSATDALGFKYLFDYAEQQQKPCVVSFSEGYTPYFDEDDLLYSQFLERLTGPGRILVVAAGNENNERTRVVKSADVEAAGGFVRNYHQQGLYRIRTDAPLTITFYGYERYSATFLPPQDELHFYTADEWTDDTVTDTLLVGQGRCAVTISRYPSEFSAHTIYQIQLSSEEVLNDLGPIAIVMEGAGTQAELTGSSTNALTNLGVDARWTSAIGGSNILAPGCFDAALCVGATTHRTDFTDVNGQPHHVNDDEIGKLSFYSSTGPTISGQVKPDVTAPGTTVVSSLSSYYLEQHPDQLALNVSHFTVNGRTYPWGINSGTSMACPVVAGTIALWLQANPTLTRDDIMAVLQRTCRQPDPALTYPNSQYGYGDIDAYRGLLDILGLTAIPEISLHQAAGVTVQAGQGQLHVTLPHAPEAPLTLSLYATSGTLLLRTLLPAGVTTHTLPIPSLSPGIYAVQLTATSPSSATTPSSAATRLTGSQLVRIR